MQTWSTRQRAGFSWPLGERTWINPSECPNLCWRAATPAPSLAERDNTLRRTAARHVRWELFGAPDLDARGLIAEIIVRRARLAEGLLPPARVLVQAPFHKHAGKQPAACGPSGWRLPALRVSARSVCKRSWPSPTAAPLWRDFAYR